MVFFLLFEMSEAGSEKKYDSEQLGVKVRKTGSERVRKQGVR